MKDGTKNRQHKGEIYMFDMYGYMHNEFKGGVPVLGYSPATKTWDEINSVYSL